MLKMFIVAILLGAQFTLAANAQEVSDGVVIPYDGNNHAYRLDVEIPITKSFSTVLTIWNQDGKCLGRMGKLDIDFKLPPPCDIMTKGAANYGFKPHVRYNEKGDRPTSVMFQIVGALKYYPNRRAECGQKWRNIELKWPGPTVNLSELHDTIADSDGLHCPRSYYEQKVNDLP